MADAGVSGHAVPAGRPQAPRQGEQDHRTGGRERPADRRADRVAGAAGKAAGDRRSTSRPSSWWPASTAPARPPRSASSRTICRATAPRCCWPRPTPSAPPRASSSWSGPRPQHGGDRAASRAATRPSVCFDAVSAGKARGKDVVLVDTAGRLPTQLHLMEELRKIKRVVQKADATAPHEVLLVIDGNTGQNALAQVRAFDEALRPHRPDRHQARRHGQGRRAGGDCARAAGAGVLHRRGRAARRPGDLQGARVRAGAAGLSLHRASLRGLGSPQLSPPDVRRRMPGRPRQAGHGTQWPTRRPSTPCLPSPPRNAGARP